MAWLTDDMQHEGAPVLALTGDRVGGPDATDGVICWPVASGQGSALGATITEGEAAAWSEVTGWRSACSCGWVSEQEWTREQVTSTLTGKDLDAWESVLADGGTVYEAARDAWDEHVRPITERAERLAAIEAAAGRYWEAKQQLDQAVAAGRQEPALSWADIGGAAGMTRQSAHERWSRQAVR